MGIAMSDQQVLDSLKLDEKRIKTEFLFTPMTIKGVTKWLEVVGYMEIKVTKTMYRPIDPSRTKEVTKWIKFKWM